MKQYRTALISGLGFFALAGQTLLFRDFLTAFEGSELGIGSFFGSWLLWVALGALVGRIASPHLPGLTKQFELTALLFIPAFLVQQLLIAHARSLGGVAAFEVYPFGRMIAVSMIANAPISFVTGLLFTLACRWWERETSLPAARVYILEAFGSFVGGITVTLFLGRGVTGEWVICCAALLLVISATVCWFGAGRSERSGTTGSVLLVLLAGFLVIVLSGFADWWSWRNNRLAWTRLLPVEEFRGSFTTAQAKYLVGRREGQFVVASWGGVSETLPNTLHASEVIAVGLCQQPAVRDVLVVGPDSLGIGLRFTELPQIRNTVWLHPDPDYPPALLEVLPPELKTAAQKVTVPATEVREYLRSQPRRFDLILLNLPDPTTLVLNRYWTQEFFVLVQRALTDDGIVCARITGAANFMGPERILLGCSALVTLESVFDQVVLKPGDESWLIASNGASLTTAPADLRDQFAKVQGASGVYPPDGLMSLYMPDRIEFQMDKYREAAASADPAMLLNQDEQPKAMLFSLLLAFRQTALLSLAQHVPILWASGIWIVACPVLIYGLLRLVYQLAPRGGRSTAESCMMAAAFDGRVLIFATGLAGMALSVSLMFMYQSRFGSLFLHIGLISSLFMLGSFVGSLVSERLVGQANERTVLLLGCLLFNLVFVAGVLVVPDGASQFVYALLFAGSGVFVGVYFPIGAYRLRAAGQTATATGASLEMLDYLGGATGALLSGWFLLPLLGTELTLCVLALFVAVNLIPIVLPARTNRLPAGADRFDRLARPAGYTLFGVAASVLIVSHVLAKTQTEQAGQRVLEVARTMTEGDNLVPETTTLDDGSTLRYWVVPESEQEKAGFIFSTESLAHGISGYGGPVVMVVFVEREGTLRALQIVHSHETPVYVESLSDWLKELPGHEIFQPSGLDGVDAVSGATMTSDAILRALRQAGPQFASTVLEMDVAAAAPSARHRLDRQFVCLAVLLGGAILLRYFPNPWLRRGLLLATLVATGILWNLQYSSQQVMAILSLNFPGNWLSGSFLLVLVVPLVVIFMGNVYCGYVCPFGALQELVGDMRPRAIATDPDRRVWRYGRAVKYLLLSLLVVLFGVTRDYGTLSGDPLLTVFSSLRDHWSLWIAVGLIVLSFAYRRFWCRNLCPAGAFLAVLGSVKLLRRWMPRPGPARCDLGVRVAGELDCLFCDRCKHAKD